MANKKKRHRHRQPIAPPVHSAPSSGYSAPIPRPPSAPRPEGVEPPVSVPAPERGPETPRRSRQTPSQIRNAKRRKERTRNWLIFGTIFALLIGGIVFSKIQGGKANAAFTAVTEAAGCGKVQNTGESGSQQHLAEGETTKYDSSPPSHGKHAQTTLGSGVYDKPLSSIPTDDQNIYKAVHSMEHGAVIVWYDKISKKQLSALEDKYKDENKVLVVPYPPLKGKTHMALTSWGHVLDCPTPSTKVVGAYVTRYREARTAPEPKSPI